jgi:hypothetical protein
MSDDFKARAEAKYAALEQRRRARQAVNQPTATPPIVVPPTPAVLLSPVRRTNSNESTSSTVESMRNISLSSTTTATDDFKARAEAKYAALEQRRRQRGDQSKPQTIIINDDLDDVTRAAAKLQADFKQFIPSGSSPLPSSPSAPKTLSLFFKPDTEGSYDANQLWVYYDPIDTAQLQDFVQEEESKPAAGTLSTEKDYDDDHDSLLLNERVAILSKVLVLYSRADMVRCFKEFADAKVVKDVDGKSFMNAEEMDKYLCVYLGMLSSNDPSKLPQSITIIQNIITSMKQHIGDRPCLDQMERLLDQLYKE